jgi:hypothetical protein
MIVVEPPFLTPSLSVYTNALTQAALFLAGYYKYRLNTLK